MVGVNRLFGVRANSLPLLPSDQDGQKYGHGDFFTVPEAGTIGG